MNIYQPWVRPIVRGKDKNKIEFGSKIDLTEVGGFSRINHFSREAFNEGKDLISSVENFRKLYGRYPRYILIDKIYLTRENRNYLKKKNIFKLVEIFNRYSALENQQTLIKVALKTHRSQNIKPDIITRITNKLKEFLHEVIDKSFKKNNSIAKPIDKISGLSFSVSEK